MNYRLRIASVDQSVTLLVIDKVLRDLHYLEIDYRSMKVHSYQGQSNLYYAFIYLKKNICIDLVLGPISLGHFADNTH